MRWNVKCNVLDRTSDAFSANCGGVFGKDYQFGEGDDIVVMRLSAEEVGAALGELSTTMSDAYNPSWQC